MRAGIRHRRALNEIDAIGDGNPDVMRPFGNVVSGAFTPVLAKQSESFSLIDCVSVGVDRMQRNFEPMRRQVEASQRNELSDVTAKVVIYEAFVEGRLEAPKHLAGLSTTCILSRSTRNSGREQFESVECIYFRIPGT